MRKLLLAGATVSLLSIAGRAFAADMPNLVAPVPVFSWTSCFLGAHIGGGWVHQDISDPVALVQNSFWGRLPPGSPRSRSAGPGS
jgi:outer membrane immunogenic protein